MRFALLAALGVTLGIAAERHRESPTASPSPLVSYTLRVDSADLGGWSVEMRLRNVPDRFRLAMARHPEYDDRFWRYVRGVGITGANADARIVRTDSAEWTVTGSGGSAVVRYRVELPPPTAGDRGAWRPFLTPAGGLVGDLHSFMYLVEATRAPARVTFDLPAGWSVATALRASSDPRAFTAANAAELMESPALVGHLHVWRYEVLGVPHRVVYWLAPGAPPFDSTAFVDALSRLTREAAALFGGLPYRDYTFLYQDHAYGALEHPASVTVGAPAAQLATNALASIAQSAHEYFHAWNLMRIRPADYGGLTPDAPAPSSGLWFSEGLTMYYADALLRRAGLPTSQPTRDAHLAALIEGYLNAPGESHYSAEAVSRVADDPSPAALGDYAASPHRMGELLGTALDLSIREATDGTRSMDDVMRLMLARYAGERGFTGADVERTVEEVCRCDVRPLFDGSVRSAGVIDFAPPLRALGYRLGVSRAPAVRDGAPMPDTRVLAWQPEGESGLRLRIYQPDGAWARAGLHTGDRIVSINGTALATSSDFRAFVGRLRMGDTVRVVVARDSGPFATIVPIAGYERAVVRILPLDGATPAQVARRERWLSGW